MQVEERFECWNRGEFDLMIEPYADDAVFDVSRVFTDVAPLQGRETIRRYWQQLRETWDRLRLVPMEVFDAGDNRYVLHVRLWGTGRSSGAEVDQRFAFVYTWRDGKVVRAELHPDLTAAMSAAESSAPSTT